jgi:hypothetical protein
MLPQNGRSGLTRRRSSSPRSRGIIIIAVGSPRRFGVARRAAAAVTDRSTDRRADSSASPNLHARGGRGPDPEPSSRCREVRTHTSGTDQSDAVGGELAVDECVNVGGEAAEARQNVQTVGSALTPASPRIGRGGDDDAPLLRLPLAREGQNRKSGATTKRRVQQGPPHHRQRTGGSGRRWCGRRRTVVGIEEVDGTQCRSK